MTIYSFEPSAKKRKMKKLPPRPGEFHCSKCGQWCLEKDRVRRKKQTSECKKCHSDSVGKSRKTHPVTRLGEY